MTVIDRRSFLRASLFIAAAPLIVRASSLMKLPIYGVHKAYIAQLDGTVLESNFQKIMLDGKIYWIAFGPSTVL